MLLSTIAIILGITCSQENSDALFWYSFDRMQCDEPTDDWFACDESPISLDCRNMRSDDAWGQ